MEDESMQMTNAESAQNEHGETNGEKSTAKPPSHGMRHGEKGLGWGVWVIIILIGFLLVSSLANLVVSQRAYESSRKQVRAIEQLTQSIKDIQRSIVDLSKMMEQAAPEDEEPEADMGGGTAGDGSI